MSVYYRCAGCTVRLFGKWSNNYVRYWTRGHLQSCGVMPERLTVAEARQYIFNP